MPETAPRAAIPSPHVSTAQWQSFEMRMRQRRATRLTARAQAALEQGMVAEAEAALQEARTLDSSSPDLDALQARLAAFAPMIETFPAAETFSAAAIEAPASRSSAPRFRLPLAIAASLLLVTALGIWGRSASQHQPLPASPSPAPTPPVVTRQAIEAPAAPLVLPATTDTSTPPPPSALPAARVLETRAAELPAAETIPVAPPAPRQPESSASFAPAAASATPVHPLREEPISEPPVRSGIDGGLAVAAPPPALPAVAAPPPALPAVAAPQPEPAPEPARIDETPSVRRVLAQYEAAYSSLDVSAAKRVWPGLDSRALSRAFDGLQSQRVSLGQCEVSLAGAGARAACHGSTTWTPKVGGGARSEARSWSFNLRKGDGGEWRIVDAMVR